MQRQQLWEKGTKWWYLQGSGSGSHGEPLHFADVLLELGLFCVSEGGSSLCPLLQPVHS